MMEASVPIPDLELLIRHRSFVRQIARGVLGDAAAAEDVAQDALVAACRAPSRATPRSTGWWVTLARNLSRNLLRSAARRGARERTVAPTEVAMPADPLERAETAQKIVRIVLELDEPYRRVVLLRYFDDLSPQQIARRLGLSEGTVRSRLHRAHAELRRRLEPEFGSARKFALALFGLAEAPARAMSVPASVVVATSLAIVGGAAWYGLRASPTTIVAEEQDSEPLARVAVAAIAPPVVATDDPVTRTEAESAVEHDASEHASVVDLLADARAVQAALRLLLLTPKPEFAALGSKWGEEGGVARILGRDVWEFELREPLAIRGGGAYFSFATRSHSYDDEPDLQFEGERNGNFRTSFYGGTEGFLRSLGDLRLEVLSDDPQSPPPAVDASIGAVWSAMLSPIGVDSHDRVIVPPALTRVGDQAKAALGTTYVLRAVLPGEHDHAVAFRAVDRDEYGYTIEYRILKRFPMAKTRDRAPTPALEVSLAPELKGLSAEQLLHRLEALRRAGDVALLTVSEELAARARSIAHDGTARVSRILPRGTFGAICTPREGGAYLSFTTGSNDYDHQPTIGLDSTGFQSGFYGGTEGVVVDLGAIPLRDAEHALNSRAEVRELATIDLGDEQRKIAAFREALERTNVPGWQYAAKAEVGHTYFVRKVCDGDDEPSVIAFFQAVERDAYGGYTIAWRTSRVE